MLASQVSFNLAQLQILEVINTGRLKMQVRKTQVQICRGGKRKYGNGKSDLNSMAAASAVVRKVSQGSNGIFAADF